MDEEIDRGLLDISDAVGNDLSYFHEEPGRYFDPITLALGVAALLAIDFAKGFVKVAQEHSKHLGESFANELFEHGKKLLDKNKDQQKEEAKQAVTQLKAASSSLTDEEKAKASRDSEEALVAVLLMHGITAARAAEIAQQTSDIATKMAAVA